MLLNQTSNSPTRKGGLESSCTSNGCADSISLTSDSHVEYSTLINNNKDNNSKANDALNNEDDNSKANAVVNNDNDDYKANADLSNLTIPYLTWCHTGELLRSDASVAFSILDPLTHGSHNKE